MSFEPAPIDRVSVSSPFYLQIDERMRKTTLQAILDSLKSTGRFYALSWTPESAPTKAHCFWDSDVYKTMEACCYYLMKKDDAQIRADVEEIVGYIKKAQWEDGFVSPYVKSCPVARLADKTTDISIHILRYMTQTAALPTCGICMSSTAWVISPSLPLLTTNSLARTISCMS